MKETVTAVQSAYDGLMLDVLTVAPASEPVGLFQISHGMAEHKERYLPFMRFLADHGWLCVINDHRGHGRSIKSKEDRGFFYDDKAEAIVEDLHQISEWIRIQYPHLPLVLFGHSMGSLVVRKYVKKYDDELSRLIVCGSPSNNPAVGAALSLTKVLQHLRGDHHRSNLINSLAFGSYDKKFPEKNPNSWLSRNQANVEEYNLSEDDGFVFTVNGFLNLFTLIKDVYDADGWMMKYPDLPILFIAGADDPVILNEQAWKEAQQFMKERGYHNVDGRLYPDLRHEILLEEEADQVMNDVLAFISQK